MDMLSLLALIAFLGLIICWFVLPATASEGLSEIEQPTPEQGPATA